MEKAAPNSLVLAHLDILDVLELFNRTPLFLGCSLDGTVPATGQTWPKNCAAPPRVITPNASSNSIDVLLV